MSKLNDLIRRRLETDSATLVYNLNYTEMFARAIADDRGRIRWHGSDSEHKAYQTAAGSAGPLIYYSDPSCTGRPVDDTYAVAWADIVDQVWWKADLRKFQPEHFRPLVERVLEHLDSQNSTLFVQDAQCGSDPDHAIHLTFIGEYATHALFVKNMFIPTAQGDVSNNWVVLNVPSFYCQPERDQTASDRAVILDFNNCVVLILGRADYCGVIKKSMFTVMNYLLPASNELPMHCAANMGPEGDTAVLFGLSGTGKTTLSADPSRQLIGDDEHAWGHHGVSNFEGGCYAKLVDLDAEAEPVIASAVSARGSVIENVPSLPEHDLADTQPEALDFTDTDITENTRISYPLSVNPNVMQSTHAPHPSTIIFLTADAFGVLPPISLLDTPTALYLFASGFTSKLGGTEVGLNAPEAVFSPCFGAPFMARPPGVYASLLADKIERHGSRCVLINTGWIGGPYGVGQRIRLSDTRTLLDSALRGELDEQPCTTHPIFNLVVPQHCPGVADELLDPRSAWSDGAAYDAAAEELRAMFRQNYTTNELAAQGIKPIM